MKPTSIVNGWEIRAGADGGFGVWDSHSLVSGPFGTTEQAMAAALRLPSAARPLLRIETKRLAELLARKRLLAAG